QLADVFRVEANASVRGLAADRPRRVGTVDRVVALRQTDAELAHRVVGSGRHHTPARLVHLVVDRGGHDPSPVLVLGGNREGTDRARRVAVADRDRPGAHPDLLTRLAALWEHVQAHLGNVDDDALLGTAGQDPARRYHYVQTGRRNPL